MSGLEDRGGGPRRRPRDLGRSGAPPQGPSAPRSARGDRLLGWVTRRRLLASTLAGLAGSAIGAKLLPKAALASTPALAWPPERELEPVAALPGDLTRTWIGPPFWANRLQDWRLSRGWIECLTGNPRHPVRTVSLLTRAISTTRRPLYLSAIVKRTTGAEGFCGFLVGAGGGRLDPRAAALCQGVSGTGGGLLCTLEQSGACAFREHTDEFDQLAFASLPVDASETLASTSGEISLRLAIVPRDGAVELQLSARELATGALLSYATRTEPDPSALLGGLGLVSSPQGSSGARYAFRGVRTGGGIAAHPERALGPVVGALHSLNGRVLKLNAQLFPIGARQAQTARLEYRAQGASAWRFAQRARIGPGYTALFRLTSWDSTRDWDYRVVYEGTEGRSRPYRGRIRRDPGRARPVTLGLVGCLSPCGRALDRRSPYLPEQPGDDVIGLYTRDNLYFPHAELARNLASHRPDLLVFSGDQLYESNPTAADGRAFPTLDYLYKWLLWVLAFRDLTRDRPAIVQTDDHDVYQANLWGDGGRANPVDAGRTGGYGKSPAWVNLVQRTQCGHDPDAFDPTPIRRGIGVYYGAFRYGGCSFAVLEDRKWKSSPRADGELPPAGRLLGERQERFLERWAGMHPGAPKICLTQTAFATLQTDDAGAPRRDADSNGTPKGARDWAVARLRRAGALVLAGDQHLPSLTRQGIASHTDAVVQFVVPAGANYYQRWFEPAAELRNGRGAPYTGDWTDAYGTRLRMLAVANPKLTRSTYYQHYTGSFRPVRRELRNDGYGVVRVDHARRALTIECWPWHARRGAGAQYAGWPYKLAFGQLRGTRSPSRPGPSLAVRGPDHVSLADFGAGRLIAEASLGDRATVTAELTARLDLRTSPTGTPRYRLVRLASSSLGPSGPGTVRLRLAPSAYIRRLLGGSRRPVRAMLRVTAVDCLGTRTAHSGEVRVG